MRRMFSEKQIKEIVNQGIQSGDIEIPSGFYVINVNTGNLDQDGYLIEDDDVRLLKSLILKVNSGEGLDKPVLMNDSESGISGMLNFSGYYATIIGHYLISGGHWDGLSGIAFQYDDSDDKIAVFMQEI